MRAGGIEPTPPVKRYRCTTAGREAVWDLGTHLEIDFRPCRIESAVRHAQNTPIGAPRHVPLFAPTLPPLPPLPPAPYPSLPAPPAAPWPGARTCRADTRLHDADERSTYGHTRHGTHGRNAARPTEGQTQ
eukprot:scaffold4434_cov109-Isochrysis_galbana.AAC.14